MLLLSEDIFAMRTCVDKVYLDEKIENYVLDIVLKTREPSPYIACGASPRASINLIKAAKCRAFLMGRDYAVPDDIKAVVYDVLRHRILLSYEAEAEEISAEDLIAEILRCELAIGSFSAPEWTLAVRLIRSQKVCLHPHGHHRKRGQCRCSRQTFQQEVMGDARQ